MTTLVSLKAFHPAKRFFGLRATDNFGAGFTRLHQVVMRANFSDEIVKMGLRATAQGRLIAG